MIPDGVLINGRLFKIGGLRVVPPASHGGPAWNRIGGEDFRPRPGSPNKIIDHTTGGHWPQPILPGAGPGGHAKEILDDWDGANRGGGERIYSSASVVIDFDGVVYNPIDLWTEMTWHAEASNATAVGIEMCTTPRGEIYSATLDATVTFIRALTWSGQAGGGLLPIPFQIPLRAYPGRPLRRMETTLDGKRTQLGGASMTGVFGHRDNTSTRGRGDPGDEIFARLEAAGAEIIDYDQMGDLVTSRRRQAALNARGEQLQVDGICGPASLAAAARHGFLRWRDVS